MSLGGRNHRKEHLQCAFQVGIISERVHTCLNHTAWSDHLRQLKPCLPRWSHAGHSCELLNPLDLVLAWTPSVNLRATPRPAQGFRIKTLIMDTEAHSASSHPHTLSPCCPFRPTCALAVLILLCAADSALNLPSLPKSSPQFCPHCSMFLSVMAQSPLCIHIH